MSIQGLEITEVQVHPVRNKVEGSKVEGFAKVVLNGQLSIRGLRIVKGRFGTFVSYPSQYDKKEGKNHYYMFPVTKDLQGYLSAKILDKWELATA